nr:nucleotidyltransferase family protein [Acidobacteriota bacterium]
AIDHGIGALLCDALAGESGAGATLRDALTPGVRAAAARDVLEQRELQAVTMALADAGVPSLITKGAALAYTVYRQPWLRPRIDTDLLVRARDMPSATLVLERCGYSRSHAVSTGALVSHQIVFQRIDAHRVSHVIDLHWKTANPQVVADALAFDDLWNDAQPAPALGGSARVPPAVASLALACVHRLAHHQRHDRLIWLYDVKLLAAALSPNDWSSFRELACGHGIAGFCLDGLRSAQAHLYSQLPHAVEDALAAAAPTEASRAYVSGFVTKRDVLWSDLKTLDTWSDRVRLVREHAFPPVAFIQQRYGTSARWLLPALYVHRLVTGASRWGRS